MEEPFEHPVYSKNVVEFVTVANEYCNFIEESGKFSRKDLILTAQRLLPILYLKSTLLPEVEPELEEANEKFVTEADWNFIDENLKEKLGEFDDFLEVFDPQMEESEHPVPQSLAENFADIYQDLKDFLTVYRIGNVEMMNDGLWECNESFKKDWGQKLVNSLRALHNIYYGDHDLESEEGEKSPNDIDLEHIDTSNWLISKKIRDFKDGSESESE